MLSTHDIGMLSLNISFFLYLIVYLPQIYHNKQTQHLENLSIATHNVLFLGLYLDLMYGFSSNFQWQYKTVSCISLFVISIQHLQLAKLNWKRLKISSFIMQLMIFITALLVLIYFFIGFNQKLSAVNTLIIGYISRCCCLLYSVPQIFKNKNLIKRSAISQHFILINITLIILDTISSWCLNWGWPNKLSTPIALVFMLILLRQQKSS